MASEQKKLLCLLVTDEEKEYLEAFFLHFDMELNIVDPSDMHKYVMTGESESDKEISGACSSLNNDSDCQVNDVQVTGNSGQSAASSLAPISSRSDPSAIECDMCLCAPCITAETNRQMWWPAQAALPSVHNRTLRNKPYMKFWAMLQNRGLWNDDRYLQIKAAALGQDPERKHYKWHRRDLMPACVLDQVRHWLPKTKTENYVGHKWKMIKSISPECHG